MLWRKLCASVVVVFYGNKPEMGTYKSHQITHSERKMIFQTSMIMFQPLIFGGVEIIEATLWLWFSSSRSKSKKLKCRRGELSFRFGWTWFWVKFQRVGWFDGFQANGRGGKTPRCDTRRSREETSGAKFWWENWVYDGFWYWSFYPGKWSNLTNIFPMGWNHHQIGYPP